MQVAAQRSVASKDVRDMALEALDHLGTGRLIRPDDIPQVFRVKLTGEHGGVHEVAEHDGELAALGLGGEPVQLDGLLLVLAFVCATSVGTRMDGRMSRTSISMFIRSRAAIDAGLAPALMSRITPSTVSGDESSPRPTPQPLT